MVTLGLLCVLGLGFAAGVATSRPDAPASLRGAPELALAPVTTRAYDDARSVTVAVVVEGPHSPTVLKEGRVTSSSCVPGSEVQSGTTTIGVDGQALVNLHTEIPLWRGVAVGSRGRDVESLNSELRRLGFPAPEGDRATRATVSAYRSLALALGAAEPVGSVIDHTAVVWLPDQMLVVEKCAADVGAAIAPGDQAFTVPAALSSATILRLPDGAAAGERTLLVDDEVLAIGADGTVTDVAALGVIARTRTYAEAVRADPDSIQLAANWVLRTPVTVLVVPPGSVFGYDGSVGCLVGDEGDVHRVTVVGSQLGQSFVTTVDPGIRIAAVEIAPDASLVCE